MEGYGVQIQVDGKPFPVGFDAEKIKSGKKIQTYTDDVIIGTYPKCGTTWVRHIICQLMIEDYKPRAGKELFVYTPTIEVVGKEAIDRMSRPRILKSHMTYGDIPKSFEAKYVFVVRNPKDVLVSAYHMAKNMKAGSYDELDFDMFFELFMRGKYAVGCYFDYHKEWLCHLNDHNSLLLKYEDMVADLKDGVEQIGKFLGGRAAEITRDSERLVEVVEASTFNSMKEDQGRWMQDMFKDQQQFVRKGTPRDWKNYFTQEQSDRVDEKFKATFKDTIAENWWQEEMKWED
ncbi:hypothetical protein L596_019557 [Steinernema carpocapsae]|uniref:Sulfotransferase domain-containing protein n=1 Tax=Steinernema carpocapsae TaxID=34508 RepID=A0A4U5MQZ4_STECR|nr:hypothetical protein L596_019557 [Steinernema carpocapsae]